MRWTTIGLTVPCLFLLACKPGEAGDDTTGTAGSTGSTGDGVSTGGTVAPDPTTGGSGGVAETSGDTGGGGSNSGTTTAGPSTSTGVGPTGDPGTGPDTGLGDGCEAFHDEKSCGSDPDCMPIVGEAQDFPGCSADPQFLACVDAMACDDVLLTVCRDGTDEVYQLSSGCFPPGFTPCDGPGQACGVEDCSVHLSEVECKEAACAPILGAPHVEMNGGVCADFKNMEFLGCFDPDMPCPPAVPTVCPAGKPEPAWDVPSGCVPAGFEVCGELAPECP
jgi:hypothetical protein